MEINLFYALHVLRLTVDTSARADLTAHLFDALLDEIVYDLFALDERLLRLGLAWVDLRLLL